MKVEDVFVGMKVQLISINDTDYRYGYDEDTMLSVGDVGVVEEIVDDEDYPPHVMLEDERYYSLEDLEPVVETKESIQAEILKLEKKISSLKVKLEEI
mgnify:CR=1 FL=1